MFAVLNIKNAGCGRSIKRHFPPPRFYEQENWKFPFRLLKHLPQSYIQATPIFNFFNKYSSLPISTVTRDNFCNSLHTQFNQV